MAAGLMEEAPADLLFAQPRHPYSQALLDCVPRLEDAPGDLQPIGGSGFSLTQAGNGCPYRPRCPLAGADCAVMPPETRMEAGRAAVLEGFGMTDLLALQDITKVFELENRLIARLVGRSRPLRAVGGGKPVAAPGGRARPRRARERQRQVDPCADHRPARASHQRSAAVRRRATSRASQMRR